MFTSDSCFSVRGTVVWSVSSVVTLKQRSVYTVLNQNQLTSLDCLQPLTVGCKKCRVIQKKVEPSSTFASMQCTITMQCTLPFSKHCLVVPVFIKCVWYFCVNVWAVQHTINKIDIMVGVSSDESSECHAVDKCDQKSDNDQSVSSAFNMMNNMQWVWCEYC